MVGPHLAAVCAYDPTERTWNGQVPAVSLLPPHSLFTRAVRRIGFTRHGGAADSLRKALRQFRPEQIVLHYLDFAAQFEAVLNSCDQDVFIHCHGYDITWDLRNHDTPETPYFNETYKTVVGRLAKRATLIANSEYTKQQLLSIGVASERIVVKYLGVPVPQQPRNQCSGGMLRILYFGRLVDCKGPHLTIEAFERASDRGLEAHLLLAGAGEMKVTCELMKARSRYSDRIRLLGAVDADVGAKLRNTCDIFTAHNCMGTLTHQVEAFGVSIVEAMADSLPVVSTRSGGVVESVVQDETGLLVEPGDVEGHANALLALARDARRRRGMGEAGWRRAKEHFSVDKERASLLRILGLAG